MQRESSFLPWGPSGLTHAAGILLLARTTIPYAMHRGKPSHRRLLSFLLLGLTILTLAPALRAQSLEPRAYANLPIGLNFLLAGYAYSRGDVLLDPSLPVSDASARINAFFLGYVRSLDVAGRSGSVGLVLPYAGVSASGQITV